MKKSQALVTGRLILSMEYRYEAKITKWPLTKAVQNEGWMRFVLDFIQLILSKDDNCGSFCYAMSKTMTSYFNFPILIFSYK